MKASSMCLRVMNTNEFFHCKSKDFRITLWENYNYIIIKNSIKCKNKNKNVNLSV